MLKSWRDSKNILCIRTDNLGDVIMTSPAIKAIKETSPGRKVTLLTSPSGKSSSKLIPYIDDVIYFDFPWMSHSGKSEVIHDALMHIEREDFDAAVIFNVYSQNPLPAAMLCKMAGIQKIASYCRENPYGLLTDWFPDDEPLFEIKHEVRRQIDLVKNLGFDVRQEDLVVHVDEDTNGKTLKLLDKEGLLSDRKYIVIHPGVSEERRQFPIEVLAEAVSMIARHMDYQLVLTGLDKEKILTSDINEKLGGYGIDLAGKLSIMELASVIKNASLIISNNTGPVHLAAALQTPIVVLYANTNPQHLPWNVPYIALPFDIPDEIRSKNVIIKYAYEKSFKEKPAMVKASDIADACQNLIESTGKKEKSGLYL